MADLGQAFMGPAATLQDMGASVARTRLMNTENYGQQLQNIQMQRKMTLQQDDQRAITEAVKSMPKDMPLDQKLISLANNQIDRGQLASGIVTLDGASLAQQRQDHALQFKAMSEQRQQQVVETQAQDIQRNIRIAEGLHGDTPQAWDYMKSTLGQLPNLTPQMKQLVGALVKQPFTPGAMGRVVDGMNNVLAQEKAQQQNQLIQMRQGTLDSRMKLDETRMELMRAQAELDKARETNITKVGGVVKITPTKDTTMNDVGLTSVRLSSNPDYQSLSKPQQMQVAQTAADYTKALVGKGYFADATSASKVAGTAALLGLPIIYSQKDYDNLPTGGEYVDPNSGKVLTKKGEGK